ncbi:hypothetical protein CNR37_00162 [Pseudomonas phage ventosus]|uniref:Uncharacterized protein n=1 Tax=Pseudomonas phage ventosus TaxID=2048980 RepID=A0A2H4P871_9CAUD|nr:hypothetical protein CNR37_00162 [Pseudomonas phage ventosus]
MTRKQDWPVVAAIGALLIALLVCICLLAFPAYNNKTSQVELEVAKQEFNRRVEAVERKYEQKINNLQEQINTEQFVSNKRYDIMDDDIKRMKREIDDLRERLRTRSR